MMRAITAHKLLKVFFWYLAVLISNSKKWSPKALNVVQNGNFSILSLFGGHFCYDSNGKSEINARLLHFGYSSYKPIRRNCREATFRFWLQRGIK